MALYTSMGQRVMRAAANHAVESSKENSLIAHAEQDRREIAIQQDHVSREISSSLEQFQGAVDLGLSVVNLGMAVAKVAEAAQDLSHRAQAMPQLEKGIEGVRKDLKAGRTLETSQAFKELREVNLGDRKVKDRFTDAQLGVLVRGDTRMSDVELKAAGFSDAEIAQVRELERSDNGVKHSASFLFEHRQTASETSARKFRDDLQKALQEHLGLGVQHALEGARDIILEAGRQSREEADDAERVEGEVEATDADVMRELEAIDLNMMRDQNRQA